MCVCDILRLIFCIINTQQILSLLVAEECSSDGAVDSFKSDYSVSYQYRQDFEQAANDGFPIL